MDKSEFLKAKDDRLIAEITRKKTERALAAQREAFISIGKDIVKEIKDIRIEAPSVKIPDIHIPPIRVPEIRVPEIKVPPFPEFPKIEIPEIKLPAINVPKPEVKVNVAAPEIPPFPKFPEFPKQKEYSWKDPLPVILTDAEGKPYTAGYFGGSGGGTKAISDLQQLAGLPIAVNSGETNNSTLRVVYPTDAIASVYAQNPFGQGDSATALRVVMAGDSGASVSATQVGVWTVKSDQTAGVTAAWTSATALDTALSATVTNYSTASISLNVSGSITAGTLNFEVSDDSGTTWYAARIARNGSAGLAEITYAISGGNQSWIVNAAANTTLRVRLNPAITGTGTANIRITPSAAATEPNPSADISGWIGSVAPTVGQKAMASSLPVVIASDQTTYPVTATISGSLTSAVVTGPSTTGVVDDGTAPVQIGGIARTTNPTKVTDGQVVKSTYDAIGRQLVRPVQVRELLTTAYLSFASGLAFGDETALKAAPANTFLDLVYITASNSSDVALSIDIRSETAAGIVASLQVPASGTTVVAYPVPLPQNTAAATWTVDPPDITGTTLNISALFSQEL